MSKVRVLLSVALSKVNGVYAATGAAGGCSLISLLPMFTEWVKLFGALGALASTVLSFVLAYRKRKAEKNKR